MRYDIHLEYWPVVNPAMEDKPTYIDINCGIYRFMKNVLWVDDCNPDYNNCHEFPLYFVKEYWIRGID